MFVISDEAAVVLADLEGVDGVFGEEGIAFFKGEAFVVGAENDAFFCDAGFEGASGVFRKRSSGGDGFPAFTDGESKVAIFEIEGPSMTGAALGYDDPGGGKLFNGSGDGEGALGDVG